MGGSPAISRTALASRSCSVTWNNNDDDMPAQDCGRQGRKGEAARASDGDAAPGELGIEIERPRADRLAVGHRPEQLELEPVGILRVEREAHAVIRLTHEGAGLDQRAARPREVGEILHLPRRAGPARGAPAGGAPAPPPAPAQ